MSVKITDNRVNLDKLINGLKELDKKAVIVGVMEDESRDIQVVASANEFGATIKSPKALRYMRILAKKYGIQLKGAKRDVIIIPERSYIRSTFDDSEVQNKIIETIRFYFFKAISAQNTFEEAFSRAGNYLQRMIQARMANTPPPNHPLTEAIKGHNTTLIGKTKKLISSIKSKIINQ